MAVENEAARAYAALVGPEHLSAPVSTPARQPQTTVAPKHGVWGKGKAAGSRVAGGFAVSDKLSSDSVGVAGATPVALAFCFLADRWGLDQFRKPCLVAATPHGRLMLTVLGGLAEFERHLILARTSDGRQRAQKRGVKFGRKRKLTAHQQQEALARRAAGEALVDIARS
jgi:hypothetical protein